VILITSYNDQLLSPIVGELICKWYSEISFSLRTGICSLHVFSPLYTYNYKGEFCSHLADQDCKSRFNTDNELSAALFSGNHANCYPSYTKCMALDKSKFRKLIELASQPLPKAKEKRRRPDDYTGTQTRSRNIGDISAKRSGKSHPKNASTDSKNPQ
jgi:hypothetical protein